MDRFVPETYEELNDEYGAYIRNLLWKFGVRTNYINEMYQQMWLWMLEKDIIQAYHDQDYWYSFPAFLSYYVEGRSSYIPVGMRLHRLKTESSYDVPVFRDAATTKKDLLASDPADPSYTSADPLDIVIRREEKREARERVQHMYEVLAHLPTTDYRRFPANQTPIPDRKALSDVLRAFSKDLYKNVETTPVFGTRSTAPRRTGRQDEFMGEMLGVDRKTAKTWTQKMIEKCQQLS